MANNVIGPGDQAPDKPEYIDQALDSHRIERLLSIALSRGGDFAEIYFEYSITSAIALEENKLRQAQTGIGQGVGIRVISGDKTGYAFAESLDFENLKSVANVASHIAHSGRSAGIPAVSAAGVVQALGEPLQTVPSHVAAKAKADLLWRANQAAYDKDSHIKQVNASFVDSSKFFRVANSLGVMLDNIEFICRLNVGVVAEKGNVRQSGYHGGGGRVDFSYFNTLTPEAVALEAVRQAIVKFGAIKARAGPQTVVLANGWAGVLLHEAVGHGLEADFNRKKTSLYSDRIGQKVASALCTVIDDGTIPYQRGSINIDDEGTKSTRNVLIENGVLRGYLCDHLNALHLKTKSTGSGRRESYRHYPLPRMTNTFLMAGPYSPDEIFASVKKGFYAKSFGGGQVDISNGQFVFEVTEGYLIEDGKITAPVKGANLIGSGPDVLEKVVMVGNDLKLDSGIGTCGKNGQAVPVGVGTPTCKISQITVGGTAIEGQSLAEGEV